MLTKPDHIGFLLYDVARLMRTRFDAEARDLGVTRQQWRALLMLSRDEGQTQADLADRLEVERITCCRMVDRLSDLDLVERRADPRDRRVWRLHLTARSRALVDRLTEIGNRLQADTLSLLPPGQGEQLQRTLECLREGLRPVIISKAA